MTSKLGRNALQLRTVKLVLSCCSFAYHHKYGKPIYQSLHYCKDKTGQPTRSIVHINNRRQLLYIQVLYFRGHNLAPKVFL